MANIINNQPSMGVVRLGNWELPVVPQKHQRLKRYLSADDFKKIMSSAYSEESYRLLCILIPAMDPNNPKADPKDQIQEWEFDGFPDEESWKRYKDGDRDAYDEDRDPGPTTDEIVNAFETALKVNGTARLGKIVTLVQAASRVAELEQSQKVTDLSSMLPGQSGESVSTNSMT